VRRKPDHETSSSSHIRLMRDQIHLRHRQFPTLDIVEKIVRQGKLQKNKQTRASRVMSRPCGVHCWGWGFL
jgi:hypothetical protein